MHQNDETEIRDLLDRWTRSTREGRQDDVLSEHASDVVVYDVLPPMRYTSAADYRASWDAWQPDTLGHMTFELEDLTVHASNDAAFAFGILQCGGTLPGGKPFSDTVRASFCFTKVENRWTVAHQHISKPVGH